MSEKHPVLTKKFLQSVAHHPGVYQMKNSHGKILYVGKAKDLRKRLASYAAAPVKPSKTAALLSHVAAIETILTHTEKEALILEASLIKKYRPKYNVILRDDKNYPLLKVTVRDAWPRLLMTRRRIRDGARYFGPYSSVSAMWKTLKLLHALFPLRRCKGKEVKKRNRPCLNRQIGQCLAPCCENTNREKYQRMIDNIIMVLEGNKKKVIHNLQKQMKSAAENLYFEKAARLRDQVQALEKTLEKQIVVADHRRNQDVFGFIHKENSIAVAVIHVRKGRVSGQQGFFVAEPLGDDPRILAHVLNQYYSAIHDIPREILLPFIPDDEKLLAERFSDLKEGKVVLHVPQRGNLKKLVNMAQKNGEQILADRKKKLQSWRDFSAVLHKTLRLSRIPDRVECLDISNIGGEKAVGALVSFFNGEKDSKKYRHFKIKTLEGPDDYGMMAEVLNRYLKRKKKENDLPDLLMVDGGKGQLNVALQVLSSLDLSTRIDLLGIAKEKKSEGEKLYRPGRKNPILLPGHSPLLLFLMRVRDESHRYGITFHRKWRRRDTLRSDLDQIPGIGTGRKEILLAKLGSLKRIKEASREELESVEGIGPALARQIRACLDD